MKRLFIVLILIAAVAGGTYYYMNYVASNSEDINGENEIKPEEGEVLAKFEDYQIDASLKNSLAITKDGNHEVYLYTSEVKCEDSTKFAKENENLIMKIIFPTTGASSRTVSFFRHPVGDPDLEVTGVPSEKNIIENVSNDNITLNGEIDFEWLNRVAKGEFNATICAQ